MKDVKGIPIVFGSVPDPVGDGLVHSLARPGTNMTGLTDLSPELDAKRMEILKEALPSVRLAATLGVSDQPRTDRFRAETDARPRRWAFSFVTTPSKGPTNFQGRSKR